MDKNHIIIAPTNAKQDIFKHLLKTDNALLMGVEVIPLSVFKNNLVAYLGSEEAEFSRLYKEALNEIPATNIYHDSLRFPVFFRYFYDFANDLVRHGIDFECLEDNDKKEILVWLYNKPLISKEVKKAFDNIDDASNIEIYDCFYSNEQDLSDIKYLVNKGAKYLDINKQTNLKKEVRVAKNDTQEIAGVAQYLIKQTKDGNLNLGDVILLVNNLEENYPLIKQVLSLYGIPYNLSISSVSDAVKQYIALLKYMNNPDVETFLEACNTGAFYFKDTAIAEYIDYLYLTYDQLLLPFEYIKNWTSHELLCRNDLYKRMLKNEERVEKMMVFIREKINKLDFNGSIKDKTSSAFNLIKSNFSIDDQEEADCLNKIRELCYDVVPGLNDSNESYEILYNLLEGIRKNNRIRYTDSLEISDIYRNIPEKKVAIVLGCRQDSFPKTINKNGFFDETYIAKIKDYPSLEYRADLFNKQLDKIFDHIEKVIFSYSTNDLSGNKLYKSVYLEGYEETNWDYEQLNVLKNRNLSLSKEVAEKLYSPDEKYFNELSERYQKLYGKELKDIKDKKLIMSSSSAEQYVGCPFKYYLNHGLGIKEDDHFEVNSGILGNIQHGSLEKYFKEQKRSVEELIEECFECLKELFINNHSYLDLIKERLMNNLDSKLAFINEAVKNSRFKPHDYEKKIVHAINYDDHSVILNGSIDRLDVDETSDEFMIVDYKSSDKDVDKKHVYNGSKIQLLTYLLSEGEETGRDRAFGSAYYNMEKKRFDIDANNLGLPANELEELLSEERKSEDRYKLYTIEGKTLADDNYNVEKLSFDYDYYLDVISKIYDVISSNILSGNIDIDPRNRSCEFCNYKDICHSATKNAPDSDPIYVEEKKEVNEDDNA